MSYLLYSPKHHRFQGNSILELSQSSEMRRVYDYFCNLILDKLHAKGIEAWVAGGSVRDFYLTGKIGKDVDLFFPNVNEANKAISLLQRLTTEQVKSTVNSFVIKVDGVVYDCVTQHNFGTITNTLNHFDFTMCKFLVCKTRGVLVHRNAVEDATDKQLVFHGKGLGYNPTGSFSRTGKRLMEGYKINWYNLNRLMIAIQRHGVENYIAGQSESVTGEGESSYLSPQERAELFWLRFGSKGWRIRL